MLEMEKIGADVIVGGVFRRNRKGFGKPGEIGFQRRVIVPPCVDRKVSKIKIGIHFLEVGIINRSRHNRSPFRMAAGVTHQQILGRMTKWYKRILQNIIVEKGRA